MHSQQEPSPYDWIQRDITILLVATKHACFALHHTVFTNNVMYPLNLRNIEVQVHMPTWSKMQTGNTENLLSLHT